MTKHPWFRDARNVRLAIGGAFGIAALATFGLVRIADAQFSAPTCTPPGCSPVVIQSTAVASTPQAASINVSGNIKSGSDGTFSGMNSFGASGLSLSSAQNALYGVVASTSTGNLLLLQTANGGVFTNRFVVSATGGVIAPKFYGDGSGIWGISASNLSGGTYSNAYTFNNAGNVYTGNGAAITNVTAVGLAGGTYSNAYTFNNAGNVYTGNGAGITSINATNITSGTLADARLSGNVPLLNGNNTFTGINTFSNASNAFTGTFTGNGAGITSINATNITSGTLSWARLGSFPAACGAGQYVTAVGASLTCATPTGNSGWTDNGATVTLTTSTDNVGIGTASPQAPLHITKTSSAAETIPLILQNSDNNTGAGAAIGFNVHTSAGLITGKITNIIGGPNNYPLAFFTLGASGLAERMRLDNAGNLSVPGGTVTASAFSGNGASLNSLNASNLASGTVATARLGSGAANNTTFLRGDNTWATPTAVEVDTLQTVTNRGNTTTQVIGVGTAAVAGNALTTSGGNDGVNATGGNHGVLGTGTNYGVYGSSGSGIGVGASGGNMGVLAQGGTYGVNASGSTYGVYASGTSYDFYANGGTYGLYNTGSTFGIYTSASSYSFQGASGMMYNRDAAGFGLSPTVGYGVSASAATYGVYATGGTAVKASATSVGVDASGAAEGVLAASSNIAVFAQGSSYNFFGSGAGLLHNGGAIDTGGDLSAPNNVWGTSTGWIHCDMSNGPYCVCPNGSFVIELALEAPGIDDIICAKP